MRALGALIAFIGALAGVMSTERIFWLVDAQLVARALSGTWQLRLPESVDGYFVPLAEHRAMLLTRTFETQAVPSVLWAASALAVLIATTAVWRDRSAL
jgi:hypothetical protein